METEQYDNCNQSENIRNICYPGDNVRVRGTLVSEKRRWKEDTSGGDELAAEHTGEVEKRLDTKRGDQKGAGTKSEREG